VLKKSPKYAGLRALPAKKVIERFRRPKQGANQVAPITRSALVLPRDQAAQIDEVGVALNAGSESQLANRATLADAALITGGECPQDGALKAVLLAPPSASRTAEDGSALPPVIVMFWNVNPPDPTCC
jgi:hypothetical protein